MIIEVAFGVEDIEFLAEHSSHKFFGRRLAVGACDLQHGGIKHATMVGSQLLQRGEYVVDKKATWIFRRHFGIVHHGIGTTFGQRIERKGVAVELFTAQREKKTSVGTVTRIGRHHRMTMINIIELGECHKSLICS